MAGHYLAEFNLARLRQPLDHNDNAEFLVSLEPINALAEASSGFVWRLKDDDGQSSSFVSLPEIDDPLVIVNYSVWRDLESLKHFVIKSGHGSYLRRRRDWFSVSEQATTVCWWTPSGQIPAVTEAYGRLKMLRNEGASDAGWPITQPFPQPDA
jgi:Domain of unknown function (DUF3291)